MSRSSGGLRVGRIVGPLVLAVVLLVALAAPMAADAWLGDFFDGRASGQAVYEDMSIHPQAVHVGDRTYVVYQGEGMAPHIVAFTDDSTEVVGPYRIGDNPAVGDANRDDPSDSHGAPSLLHDPATGQLHVFWGAHLRTGLQYARTLAPGDISEWTTQTALARNVTYPQPMAAPDGTLRVFMRLDANPTETTETLRNRGRGSWTEIVSRDGGATWSPAEKGIVLRANAVNRWYARFEQDAEGRVHVAATLDEIDDSDAFERHGVYYAVRDTDGVWRDACGDSIASSPTLGVQESDVASAAGSAVATGTAQYRNQLSVAVDGAGRPSILLLTGDRAAFGPDSHAWTVARFHDGAWSTTEIARTDHLMDAGVLGYREDGTLEAFLTMEGTVGSGGAWSDPARYVDRGGDIVRWTADEDGDEWTRDPAWPLKHSDLAAGVVYNDPQLVVNGSGDAHLLFGEWDNDAGNYIHKVYLWGPEAGLRGKEFFPTPTRLGGATRYDTAVEISKRGFPTGSNHVIVASGEVYADALAGAPLANAYGAPLLLVPKHKIPPSVLAEVRRLSAEHVTILGGTDTIGEDIERQLGWVAGTSVRRISAPNRYALSAAIAAELAKKRGASDLAFVVSGEAFADALSAAPLAGVRGAPILLVRSGSVPTETNKAVQQLGVKRVIAVGGATTIHGSVLDRLPNARRIGGATRYDVAARMAELGLDGDDLIPARSLNTGRILVASGERYPDALAGGVLAARVRGPLVLTRGSELSSPTAEFLDVRARRVLDCYFLGGESTLTEPVVDAVADVLREHQAE